MLRYSWGKELSKFPCVFRFFEILGLLKGTFMSKPILAGLLLSVLLSQVACGTFMGRSAGSPIEGTYYNSTKGDLLLLGLATPDGEAHGATVVCWIMVVCPVMTVASLPIDVSIDTLLIPFDALKSSEQKAGM